MTTFHHQTIAILALSLCLATACGRADQGTEPTIHSEMTASEPSSERIPSTEVVDLRHPDPAASEEDADSNEELAVARPALDKTLGNFQITYYWVARQKKAGNEPLFDKKCKAIARVSKSFKRRLSLEGSGVLKDGRTISTAGGCRCDGPCYWIPGDSHKWGAGVAHRPLAPFRSIAVDPNQIKIGSSLYVAELDGLTMPGSGSEGGFVHDGCVVADDRGGGVRGKQIDFFAGRRAHYRNFFRRHKLTKVSVFPGGERCEKHADEHDLRLANSGSS